MTKFTKLLSLLIIFNTFIFAQDPVPIDSIKRNDANGVLLYLGQTVHSFGSCYFFKSFWFNWTSFCTGSYRWTFSLRLYFAGAVSIGDSVTVTSTLAQFNGLSEFDYSISGSSFINHGQVQLVEPQVVTINNILNQTWYDFEEYESKLIRINNVTFSATGNFAAATNYNITDPTGTLIEGLRIDNDVTSINWSTNSNKSC